MGIQADTLEATFKAMQEKLTGIVPEIELRYKAELAYEINQLKKERGAIILGHNYMEPALFHSVPDVMAETAKILNPGKKVLLPAKRAGCSLAESITADDVRELKARFPGVPVVTYINTYADVKAETDVCCTSGNAARVVNSFEDETIIFLPDEYLAANVAKETGKKIIFPTRDVVKDPKPGVDYQMIGWHGRCEVHEKFTVEDIKNVRTQFPDVLVLAHPECSPEVVTASDFSSSTSAMVNFVKDSDKHHYLLLTECSMGDNIAAMAPEKEMVRLCSIRCPHMNEITLEDTLNALRNDEQEINVPEDIRVRALKSVQRMLEL